MKISQTILSILFMLPSHAFCIEQLHVVKPHQAQKEIKASKRFWTKTKLIVAGITGAAAIALAGLVGRSYFLDKPYKQFERELNKAQKDSEIISLQNDPEWKDIAASERGKRMIQEWEHKKDLKNLQKALDSYISQLEHEKGYKIGRIYIEHNIDEESNNNTALKFAIMYSLPSDVVKQIIDLGADVTKTYSEWNPKTGNTNKHTPLQLNELYIEILQQELKSGLLSQKQNGEYQDELENRQRINSLLQEALSKNKK